LCPASTTERLTTGDFMIPSPLEFCQRLTVVILRPPVVAIIGPAFHIEEWDTGD
jgi:hypothetical protein